MGPWTTKVDVRVAAHVACLAIFASLLFPGVCSAAPARHSVLLLDRSSSGLPFNTALANTIRLTINAGSKSPVSFYGENLDANRFFGPTFESDFVNFLQAKYRDLPIDVVVVVGVSALDFMTRRRGDIWPSRSVPIIFAAIDEATFASLTLAPNATGATMQLALMDMVKVARIAVPKLKAVAIVGDPLERQTFYRHFKDELPAVTAQLPIIDLQNLPMAAELQGRLGSLPNDAAVIYTGIYFDSRGISYVPAELVTQLAAWANRPLVVNVMTYLNQGAI